MKNQKVDRPNRASVGTLSGHAAGEPFEKSVYRKLKEMYPNRIFKQYEYLNDSTFASEYSFIKRHINYTFYRVYGTLDYHR